MKFSMIIIALLLLTSSGLSQTSPVKVLSIASDGNKVSVANNSVDGLEDVHNAIQSFLGNNDDGAVFINVQNDEKKPGEAISACMELSDSGNVVIMSVAGAWIPSDNASTVALDANTRMNFSAEYFSRTFSFYPVGCGIFFIFSPSGYELPLKLFGEIEDDGKGGKYIILLSPNGSEDYESLFEDVAAIYSNNNLTSVASDNNDNAIAFSDFLDFTKLALTAKNISYQCIKIQHAYDQIIYNKQ